MSPINGIAQVHAFNSNYILIGEIGDWKNWFNSTQNDMFDAAFKEEMSGTDIQFMFTKCKL